MCKWTLPAKPLNLPFEEPHLSRCIRSHIAALDASKQSTVSCRSDLDLQRRSSHTELPIAMEVLPSRACLRVPPGHGGRPLGPIRPFHGSWLQPRMSSADALAPGCFSSSRRTAIGTGVALTGVLAAAGVAAAAAAAASQKPDPRQLVRSGMDAFRRNEVETATAQFDTAWELAPQLRPYLWQRGLAHYYVGRFDDGAAQFRSDVAVNPNDTEEAIWTFICEARTVGVEKAREQFLTVGRDSRPVMRAAYESFMTGAGPDAIKAAISDNGGHSNFYGMLYVGLYLEAHGSLDDPAAREAIQAACATTYAKTSGDYMASLARVHCLRRGWALPA